jgi:hypothetical protein
MDEAMLADLENGHQRGHHDPGYHHRLGRRAARLGWDA